MSHVIGLAGGIAVGARVSPKPRARVSSPRAAARLAASDVPIPIGLPGSRGVGVKCLRVRDAAREDAPRAFPNGDASEARLAVAATTATTRGFDIGWTPAIAGLRERIARRR